MPFRRVPGRVKDFRKWAQMEVDKAELSDSATPGNVLGRGRTFRATRRRRRKLKKEM